MTALGDRAVRVPRPPGSSAAALVEAIRAWPGVVDVVVAREDIGIYFAGPPALRRIEATSRDAAAPRTIELDVVYDGEDVDAVARAAGLSRDDVIARHAAPAYAVDTMGFAPGFAYLEGLDPRLVLPRRATPRPRVPAGSVAIANAQTAVYPFASPGGWHLLGRVGVAMFGSDGARLRLGDRVRFRPVAQLPPPPPASRPITGELVVAHALGLATVQGLARHGAMHQGVPPGGALVPELLVAANRAAGNPDDAPALEVLGRMRVRVERPVDAAIAAIAAATAGAFPAAATAIPRLRLAPGDAFADTVEVASGQGRVAYLAVRGGIAAPAPALLCAGLGAPLRAGDRLAIGDARAVASRTETRPPAGRIRVLPGPDRDAFAPGALERLVATAWRISPASDRVGTRLEGPPLPRVDGPAVSRPMVRGAIEVPADGAPIVLGPEHPTTGGYPVLAVVAHDDLGALFAIRPGEAVSFQYV